MFINRIKTTTKKFLNQVRLQGLILMYHRITEVDSDLDPWQLSVSPQHFKEQMEVIHKHSEFLPLPIKELACSLKGSCSHPLIGVTFDDGYVNNLVYAKPVLEKYEIPATFFLVSGTIGTNREFWWDELDRLILRTRIQKDFELSFKGETKRFGLNGNNEKLYDILWNELSHLSSSEKFGVLEQLKGVLGSKESGRREYFPLNDQEFIDLANSKLIEIGGHTVTHPMLSRLSVQEQEDEIKKSKLQLEAKLGERIVSFSYPHGDFSKETAYLVRKCGFENASTVNERRLQKLSNRFELPRFKVLDWNGDQFEKQLLSWMNNG